MSADFLTILLLCSCTQHEDARQLHASFLAATHVVLRSLYSFPSDSMLHAFVM